MNKRTEMQGFRTSKETKQELVDVAAHYGLLPGPFVACLVERFIDAHGKHKKLAWPPDFIHFDNVLDEMSHRMKKEFEASVKPENLDFIDLTNLSEKDKKKLQARLSEKDDGQ